MCADKAKERAGNPPAGGNNAQPADGEFFVGGEKPRVESAGKLRRLFSGTEQGKAEEKPTKNTASETAHRLPALPKPSTGESAKKTYNKLQSQSPAVKEKVEPEAEPKVEPETPGLSSFTVAKAESRQSSKKHNEKAVRYLNNESASAPVTYRVISEADALRKILHFFGERNEGLSPKVERHQWQMKNFKGHAFLRKENMQEFAYRITEVSKDWDDFRFVDPGDDIEWHRSSLNQAINDFNSGLALPHVDLVLEEKVMPGAEPQYLIGSGMILLRADDIRSAPTVDLGVLYHELLHAEQDVAVIRRITLASALLKPNEPKASDVCDEYCRQTGLPAERLSIAWIQSVIASSTDWLKRKGDEIRRHSKKNSLGNFEEYFARDRELTRAKELTEALRERISMQHHLARKHTLLVYMHREFTQNFEPHVYVQKFATSTNFRRILFGYDWIDATAPKDDLLKKLFDGKPELMRTVLFGTTEEWQKSLAAFSQEWSIDQIARLKVTALTRAFEQQVGHQDDPEAVRKFDRRYREATRRLLLDIEDGLAEQVNQKQLRHYLGVELEMEANHASHLMNKLHGQDRAATITSEKGEESCEDFLAALNELNDQLSLKAGELPQIPVEDDGQAAVVVRQGFERTAPDIILAKNRRVMYRGEAWTIADFRPDTGDVILHRAEERTVDSHHVYLAERQLILNETYKMRTADGRIEDGWVYRGRNEDKLLMHKGNAEIIEVPKLSLISVNQLIANTRAAHFTPINVNAPRKDPQPSSESILEIAPARPLSGMSWSGSQVGSYMIEDLISDRQFYWIYAGSDQSTFEKKVFKVAKPHEYISKVDQINPLRSSVLKISSVGFSPVIPNTAHLLKVQCERMAHDTELIMARIEEVISTSAICYSRIEFIEGATLRELRKEGSLPLDLAMDIVSALDTIQKNPLLRYHGDLTPDNIMISYSRVKLLDAGYYGAIECTEGLVEDAVITTPAYYPFLTPNDMLALGIIFWEMHFGQNPFAAYDENPAPAAGVSQALVRVLKGYSSIGRPFVNSMARVPLPRAIEPAIHPELERFLLASLGLRIDESGDLDPAARFESFEQMTEELRKLESHGITEL